MDGMEGERERERERERGRELKRGLINRTERVRDRDKPIPCASLDGTIEAKYFLQFKDVWYDGFVKKLRTGLQQSCQTKHL